jgi:proteasome alpha subunit
MEIFEDQYKENMSMNDTIMLGLTALQKATEGEPNVVSVEIGVVKEKETFRKLEPKEVEKFVNKMGK